MSEASPKRQVDTRDTIIDNRKAVIRVNPGLAEETIFRKLPQQVIEDEKIEDVLERLSELKSGPERVAAIVHLVMKQNVGTTLGYIIPPETGANIIKDRIVQNATVLLEMLKEEVDKLNIEIEVALREGKDYKVAENVKDIVQVHHESLIAIREIMNRYLVLYMLNMPANMRPPLAQIKLGMEIIQ